VNPKPQTSPIAVASVIVLDAHGSTHAFKFDWTPDPKRGAKVASFHELTRQTHEWAQTQPFDKGEELRVGTSTLVDPGAARLDPKALWWSVYVVEK
jgi:hypothetical protein